MYRAAIGKPVRHRRLQGDRRGAVGRLENGVIQRGRELEYGGIQRGRELEYGGIGAPRGLEYGRRERFAPARGLSTGFGYPPPMTVFVQWTPQFGMAYQQFVNGGMGGMGGYPMGGMGGMGGYPMGGMGGMGGYPGGYGGGIQGVPIGFGVTTR